MRTWKLLRELLRTLRNAARNQPTLSNIEISGHGRRQELSSLLREAGVASRQHNVRMLRTDGMISQSCRSKLLPQKPRLSRAVPESPPPARRSPSCSWRKRNP